MAAALLLGCRLGEESRSVPSFDRVQPELFSHPGAQPNAWADYDNDGDLDLFVGFRGAPNRLYRNDDGTLADVAAELGLADEAETRVAAWGDFDHDGDLDLYVGFRLTPEQPNRLYLNQADEGRFVDVAPRYGVDLTGNTRQASWVDFDGDGDLDLFVAFRDAPNRLFRVEGESFVDVSLEMGVADPRRTVGVVWFDMDRDGDLDLFVANQNGDQDAFYRNDRSRFTDVAPELGMDWAGRAEENGSVGPAVADYDNDGDLDLFIATYGPDVLWENQGDGTFANVAPGTPLAGDYHSTTAAWADIDHDGWMDLFVTSYLSDVAEVPDHLFRNLAGHFTVVTPDVILEKGGSHGVAWADFDRDGDLDLALANNHPDSGAHHLYRNRLAAGRAARSLQVVVLDEEGRWTRPGAEVRLYDADSGRLLGTRLVDSGGGYCSQGAVPVHFGIPSEVERVDVEVTVVSGGERRIRAIEGIEPADHLGSWLEIRG
jgi:hypothetical protein